MFQQTITLLSKPRLMPILGAPTAHRATDTRAEKAPTTPDMGPVTQESVTYELIRISAAVRGGADKP